MVSNISSLYSLLLFIIFFFVLVTGNSPTYSPTPAPLPSSNMSTPSSPPTDKSPTPAPLPSSNMSTPASPPTDKSPTGACSPTPAPLPSSNSSNSPPAWLPSPPSGCTCSIDPKTEAACSIFLAGQGGIFGIPRALCCRGLRVLKKADVYSCLCYVINSNITGQPILYLSVEGAVKIVSLACRF